MSDFVHPRREIRRIQAQSEAVERVCNLSETVPSMIRGRRTFNPSLVGVGPLQIGPFVGKRARLPVDRASRDRHYLAKLFYVIRPNAPGRIDVTGVMLASGKPVEFQKYDGDRVRWIRRNVLRKEAIRRERGTAKDKPVFMPGGIRSTERGCTRLTFMWAGGARSVVIRLDSSVESR